MPRQSPKVLKTRQEKAQQQILALLYLTPLNVSDEDLQLADQEPDANEIAAEIEAQKEWAVLEADPQYNPLGRKLFRRGKLEFYEQIHSRVRERMPRRMIAEELGVSIHTVKMALRELRRLTGQDYIQHDHRNRPEEFNRCAQCRGYIYQDSRGEYNPHRHNRKREIPASYLNLPGDDNEEKLDWLSSRSRL